MPTASVTASMDREIVSSRVLSYPREAVFAAFSCPERLSHWWGPAGFSNTFEQFEFEPGGRWDLVMHGPDGADYKNQSVFAEIDSPQRLVIEHQSEPHFHLIVTLEDEDGSTRVTWRQVFESEKICAAVCGICVPANEQNFDRLEAEMATYDEALGSVRPFQLSRVFDAPRERCFELWTKPEHQSWLGPAGTTIAHKTFDISPGGKSHYSMTSPNGHVMWGVRTMWTVVAPSKLVYVNSFADEVGNIIQPPFPDPWPREILSTIFFDAVDGGKRTRLTVDWRPLYAVRAERQTFAANFESMRGGWGGTFDRMAEYLGESVAAV